MKKSILLLSLVLISIFVNAQPSAYLELRTMYTKPDISDMTGYMISRGYKYQGATVDKNRCEKVWFCKNCTINKTLCCPQSTSGTKWYAHAYVTDEYGGKYNEFWTNDYETWGAAKKSAIKSGYVLENDYTDDNYTTSSYFNEKEFLYMDFRVNSNGTYIISICLMGE